MEFVYAVQSEEELKEFRRFAGRASDSLRRYAGFLRRECQVSELPRAIVFAGRETATSLLSDIPVPAYTNKYRVMFTPRLDVWRDIYLRQLDGLPPEACGGVRVYYENDLTENHLLQILGHELAHHSELFLDDFYSDRDSGVWFEEGMVEYISRSYFLTPGEFAAAEAVNRRLIELMDVRYGGHTLESFGSTSYERDFAGIYYEYWRSFLAVKALVDRFGGVMEVFHAYRRWGKSGSGRTLAEWFMLEGM